MRAGSSKFIPRTDTDDVAGCRWANDRRAFQPAIFEREEQVGAGAEDYIASDSAISGKIKVLSHRDVIDYIAPQIVGEDVIHSISRIEFQPLSRLLLDLRPSTRVIQGAEVVAARDEIGAVCEILVPAATHAAERQPAIGAAGKLQMSREKQSRIESRRP